LNTTNPFDQPIIDLACLTSNFDVAALREGIKIARTFFTAPIWDGYVLEETGPLANATTDAEIEAVVRASAAPNGIF